MAGAFMICQQMHAGYTTEEVVGRNPRFMQDPQSDPGAVAEMGQAIGEGRATVVEIINQRKDGSRFWNQVSTHGTVLVQAHFICSHLQSRCHEMTLPFVLQMCTFVCVGSVKLPCHMVL